MPKLLLPTQLHDQTPIGNFLVAGDYFVVRQSGGRTINVFETNGNLKCQINLNHLRCGSLQNIAPMPNFTEIAVAYENGDIDIYSLLNGKKVVSAAPPLDFELYRIVVIGKYIYALGMSENVSTLQIYDCDNHEYINSKSIKPYYIKTYSSPDSIFTGDVFDREKQSEIFSANNFVVYRGKSRDTYCYYDIEKQICDSIIFPAKVISADLWKDGRLIVAVEYDSSGIRRQDEIYCYDLTSKRISQVATASQAITNLTALKDLECFVYHDYRKDEYRIGNVYDKDFDCSTGIKTHNRLWHIYQTNSENFYYVNAENFDAIKPQLYLDKARLRKTALQQIQEQLNAQLQTLPTVLSSMIVNTVGIEEDHRVAAVNALSKKLFLVEAFSKIYRAILAGDNHSDKVDYLADKTHFSTTELLTDIRLACLVDPQVNKAYELANEQSNNPSHNKLFSDIYLFCFDNSKFFSRAKVDNITFFRKSSLYEYLNNNHDGILPAKPEHEIDPESRYSKIDNALMQRSTP